AERAEPLAGVARLRHGVLRRGRDRDALDDRERDEWVCVVPRGRTVRSGLTAPAAWAGSSGTRSEAVMTYETVEVFSGSPITPEELLVLAEFAAPSHFVSDDHLREAADNLAEWTDHRPATIAGALRLAA